MFSEILKIIPRLDSGDLQRMENALNTRFSKVAKKFGHGLIATLKGGGLAAAGLAILDKILNPLQQVKDVLDKSLNRADDLNTFAAQFNTSEGNLARLHAFGKATGLDAEGVNLLLGKFQQAVANAALDPSKPSAVSKFVGVKDTAEAFFEFIQARQKINKANPLAGNIIDQETFGGKQILKSSEFLNANFEMLNRLIGGPSTLALTTAAKRTGQFSDEKDIRAARRELFDIVTKGKLITPATMKADEVAAQIEQGRENKRLANYVNLQKIQNTTDRIAEKLEEIYAEAAPYLADSPKMLEQFKRDFNNSRFSRGTDKKKDGE